MISSFTTLLEVIAYRAKEMPELLAYAFESERMTYAQLDDDVRRMASSLIDRGLRPGDRCAVLLPTGLNYVRAMFALQSMGAIPFVINHELPPAFLTRRLTSARCRAAILPRAQIGAFENDHDMQLHAIEDLNLLTTKRTDLPEPKADDCAVLASTSGTSGEHRTLMLLHRNLVASARSSIRRLEIRQDDILVNWTPLYHGLGLLRFLFGGLYFGCPVYLVAPSLVNLRRWLETITSVKGTITGATDFGYRMAADLVKPGGLDLSSLRYAMNSGESIRFSTIERFETKFGVPGVIRPGYGLTEANGVCNFAPGEPLRFDSQGNLSCGRAADGLRLEIVDEEGQTQPVNSVGEIRLSGDQVFAGYSDDPAATREKLRDGWFYTGDIGHVDVDGHLFIQGRKRALIKRGGAMIVPRDIEEPAESVAAVLAAAAIGVDRSSQGIEDLIVIVETANPAEQPFDRQQLIGDVAKAITSYRGLTPNDVVLVPPGAIPRTPNGKLRHEELKRQFLEGTLPLH